jgi:phage terminase large subunit-like protein
VDHIVERRDGGTDDESNLQTLCSSCHSRKTLKRTRAGRKSAHNTKPAPAGDRYARFRERHLQVSQPPSAVAAGPQQITGTTPEQLTLVPTRSPLRPFTMRHWRRWTSDLILDNGESWHPEGFQDAFVEDVFSGVKEAWLVVPEGNGKSTLLSGLGLYHTEHRPHASVPIAASSREQAEIMYRQAEGFVLRSDRLHRTVRSDLQAAKGKRKLDVPLFVCLEGYRRINHAEGGRIQVFAADDRTGDGIIPTLGLLDELHRHRDLGLYRTWAGKLLKRDGQVVGISTAGEPGSDFEQTREAIRRRSTAVESRGFFTRYAGSGVVLHEWMVPADVEPDDFRAVKRANPLRSITVPDLREKFNSPTMTLPHWSRFVMNRPTRSSTAAIEDREWALAATDEVIPEGEPVWLGLDVAWKWDTTALVPLWWASPEHRLLGPATILTPPRDGSSLDPDLVEAALLAVHARNPVHTVVMDTTRAEQLATWIARTLGATVVDRPQTSLWAAADYASFTEALRSGWLRHSGDAGLTKHVLNAIAKPLPDGRLRFDRPADNRVAGAEQERRVIDALTAAAMVHSVAAEPAEEPEPTPGLLAYYEAQIAAATAAASGA